MAGRKNNGALTRAARAAICLEVRKKNTISFIKKFSSKHRVWLQNLADETKKCRPWGGHLFSLADLYSDPNDKEVALFCCLILSENDMLSTQHEAVYNIIGKTPFRTMILERGFVELATGDNQKKRIPGTFCLYWQLSELLGRYAEIYEEYGSIEKAIFDCLIHQELYNPFYALMELFRNKRINIPQYKLNFLLLILATSDGLGLDQWRFPNHRLLCPESKDTITFLEYWFSDYSECGLTFGKAIDVFELREQTDFFYAYLGFKALLRTNRESVVAYAKKYQSLYRNRNTGWLRTVNKMQPEISFSTPE